MSEQIKKSDIFEGDPFKDIKDTLEKSLTVLEKYDEDLKSIAKTYSTVISKANEDNLKQLKELIAIEQKTEKLTAEKIRTEQQKAKLQEANNRVELKQQQELERLKQMKMRTEKAERIEKERLEKQNAKLQKQREEESNAYKQLSKASTNYKNESKRLGAELLLLGKRTRQNAEQWDRLEKEYKEVTTQAQITDKQLKRLDGTVGDNQRKVGNYERATRGLTKAFGALGLAMGVSTVIRNTTSIIGDYNQATTDLAAISGKSAEELKPLNEQARQLGATTQFSATEVTKLQIELAKLGFTTQEITDSTGGIANFAAATGVEIPRAASLAGSALRAFGLDATEIDRVVSTLGVATTKTALDVSQLETGLSSVAPVAAAFGFSIEDTTALLGQLSNAGFDASSAATSTRNILLNLADANGSLAQELGRPIKSADDLAGALQELQSKGVDLAKALDLTDKRSVAAFQTFIGGADSLVDLRDSITDVNEELTEMAEKRLDSVSGALKLLSSAFEEQVLGLNEATGASNTFQSSILFLAENLGTIFSALTRLGAYYLIYTQRAKLATAQNFIFNGGLKNMITGIPKAITGLRGMSLSFKGLGAAMKRIPFVAIIAGLTELIFWLSSTKNETDELTESEKAYNDELERGNKIIADRTKNQEDLNSLFEKRNTLSQAQLKNLKEELEAEIALAEKNDSRIKLSNEGYQELQKNLEDVTKEIEELQEKERLEDIFNPASFSAQMRRANKELKDFSIDEELVKSNEQKSKETKLNELLEKQQRIRLDLQKQGVDIDEDERANVLLREEQLKLVNSLIKEETKNTNDSTEAVKEKKQAIIELNEIEKRLNEGQTVEEIEDDEIAQLNNAIENRYKERLTMINDMERAGTLTTEEANEQRLIMEMEALNERKRILELYGRDVTDINLGISEKQLEISKMFNEKEKEELENQKQTVQVIVQAQNQIAQAYERASERKIKALQDEQKASEEQINALKEAAKEGAILDEESIKDAEKRRREAIKEQKRIEKQQQRVQFIQLALQNVTNQLQNGKSTGEALGSTFALQSALKTLFAGFEGFYKGTDNAPQGFAWVDEKGAEIHTDKHGNIKDFGSDGGARLKFLDQGDKIIPHEKSMQLLNTNLPTVIEKSSVKIDPTLDLLREQNRLLKNVTESKMTAEQIGSILHLTTEDKRGNLSRINRYKYKR
jgi:TP901 family phage tail tape measure protein